jgi:hypothetical protein
MIVLLRLQYLKATTEAIRALFPELVILIDMAGSVTQSALPDRRKMRQ